MQFRTTLTIPPGRHPLSHGDRVLMIGSCFAENIGERLRADRFDVDINPFGVLYNPFSTADALCSLLEDRRWRVDELVEYGGCYHSMQHHSRFSHADPNVVLDAINSRVACAHDRLPRLHTLIITWGTAYVFTADGNVVANCHKLPANRFLRRRLTMEEIVARWQPLVEALRATVPQLHLLFTVSPIRHLADGAHENQVSKATLLLAVEELQALFPEAIDYFPAYEIVMDELRDYRFYAQDMTHPSPVAVDYIAQRFAETYFSPDTHRIIAQWRKLRDLLNHRVMHVDTPEARAFEAKKAERLAAFRTRYPHIGLE